MIFFFFLMTRRPPRSTRTDTLFPYTALCRSDKDKIIAPARKLLEMGFELIATCGTARFLTEQGLAVRTINKVLEGRPHIVDEIKNGDVAIVLNTTEGDRKSTSLKSSH